MTKQHKLLSLAACMSAALVASSAMAAETPAAQTSAKEVLPRTLEGYVSQDKAFWDYLKANHPYFKYLKEGRVVGKFTMSDREEEWVDFGGGDKYREDTGRTTAVTSASRTNPSSICRTTSSARRSAANATPLSMKSGNVRVTTRSFASRKK